MIPVFEIAFVVAATCFGRFRTPAEAQLGSGRLNERKSSCYWQVDIALFGVWRSDIGEMARWGSLIRECAINHFA